MNGSELPSPELDRAQPLGHAVLRDHRPGHAGGLLDVVAGAGGRVVEDHLLGRPAAQHVGELVEHLRAGLGVLVLVGQHHRVAERPAAREDRHLVHRVVARQRRRDQGVAALVVGGDELLLLAHQAGPPLRTGDHAVDRLVQRLVDDQLLVVARGEQRGLVEHVGQVGAGEPGRTPRDTEQVDVLRHRLAARVHLQDLVAPGEVGGVHGDLPVEAAGPQQRRVEDVGPVGGGDQDDAAADVEAVHLDEQLVERLLALVVAAAHAGAAVPADGVDLVDEHDRRGVLLGLLEQVADPAARRRRRTSRRSPSRRSSRRGRRPRRRRPGRAASCRCRAGRRAGRPWGSWRRRPGTSRAPGGTP